MHIWGTVLGIVAIFGAIVFIIMGIKDLLEGTGELLASGKNVFQRFFYFMVGFPLLVLGVILETYQGIIPLIPLIVPSPTFPPFHLAPTPTLPPFHFPPPFPTPTL